MDFKTFAVSSGCGLIFGLAAEKGQAYLPSVIRNQMTFSQYTMLKLFLPAVATSCGVFSLLAFIPSTRRYFHSVRKAFYDSLAFQSVGKTLLGGAILGTGMTLSGSCPGMIFVQLGTGTQHAVYTFAGCILGAVLYGMIHSSLQSTCKKKQDDDEPSPLSIAGNFVDRILSVRYVSVALPFMALLATVSILVDILFPEKINLSGLQRNGIPLLSQATWNPLLCGVCIGILQLPLAISVKDSIGGSSSYCTLVAKAVSTTTKQAGNGAFAYFKSYTNDWWQVVYVGSAALGGAASSLLSGTWGSVEGVSPLTGFIGGACLLFGARLASGCTSGHGISGTGLLHGFSLLALCSMFGGAIATAVTMKAILPS
ncbi:PREDICTED: uncharacterized protein LOC100641634 [Amphimedon queenslandica]|uniref:Uncharacterized protein n=1 Tax=Amphimedon queenslandica TaxID=400682 RepID=A0A1X7UYA2_AMPQE|nr:PREDICTED: uncharacterized protein LOC100641634 [Amphimedon queenslandica]XP_019851609.1 PREDICTED: uncharacterized protein LOC100641634 [Amphimedon queenslandica]XP_019851610.1 PREDICTED: uncharacterized protein LOC100641634 [Amphimedon queenslandica]|eukprot:XP_019851607.1 PREDICTED: uncharacterized protein LOC100641634 [Amphimedon queenslandica]